MGLVGVVVCPSSGLRIDGRVPNWGLECCSQSDAAIGTRLVGLRDFVAEAGTAGAGTAPGIGVAGKENEAGCTEPGKPR